MGGRLRIRWTSAAQRVALAALGIGSLALLLRAVEPPEPPPLPPDLGLGPTASSPVASPATGERRIGAKARQPQQRTAPPLDPRGSGEPPSRESQPKPAAELLAAATEPPPAPAPTPAAPPIAAQEPPLAATTASPVDPPHPHGGSEFGFER